MIFFKLIKWISKKYFFYSQRVLIKTAFIFIMLVFTSAAAITAKSKNFSEDFKEANRLYCNKMTSESLEKYFTLLENGFDNFEINYNIACACYKLGMIGKARFYYEKALFFKPYDSDLYCNLLIVYRNIYDNPAVGEQIIMNKRIIFFIPTKAVIIIVLILLLADIILMILLYRSAEKKKVYLIILSACVLFTFLFTMIFFVQYSEFNQKKIIVTSKSANVHIGPSENEIVLSNLLEGESGKIMEKDADYYKVKTDKGIYGWVKKDNIITSE